MNNVAAYVLHRNFGRRSHLEKKKILKLFIKRNFPPEAVARNLRCWCRYDMTLAYNDYIECKEECNEVILKGEKCIPASYDEGNMIKGIASSYCEIFQRLAYQESADYLNARSKEIITHEILSVIKKDGIDHFLPLDILIKLMLIPCFMAEEDKK